MQPVVVETETSMLAPAVLKQALSGSTPPDGEMRIQYAELLLAHALATRDSDSFALLGEWMDADPALDAALEKQLSAALAEQPDAVYAFIRNHVNEHFDPRWLPRLKLAALFSLRVAIQDADCGTVGDWLTLIAREPTHFNLNDLLHEGLLAAYNRACGSSELARQVVVLSAKRDPASLEVLLQDQDLLAALPNNIGNVIRDMNGDPLALLDKRGVEIMLVGLARAAAAHNGTMFTPPVIEQLWEIAAQEPHPRLPLMYQANTILEQLVVDGSNYLSKDALDALLVLILTYRRDDLIDQMFMEEDAIQRLLPSFVAALEKGQRTLSEAMDIVLHLVSSDGISPQQGAEIYVTMLEGQEWSEDSQPVMEQLARTLQQYPYVTLPQDTLWQLLSSATTLRDEFITKQTTREILSHLELMTDDAALVENLRRLGTQVRWSEEAGESMVEWWRGYLREQPINHLQKLDKLLDGKRGLEPERDVLGTLIALRKMLGGRRLDEFAAEIEAAFDVLEALSEAFDPRERRPSEFDPEVVRQELEARDEELPREERQILSNHLKELAHVIAEMGDQRTRSNLMRREDDLDRGLMTGEETPHSAVDTMKWLAGYWGGTNEDDKKEDE
ncbi:MAG TPA: hypothetical protein PLQ56_24765 [Aggregatilineales bacterium]|nr:hypothetical protein [Aggregatilineales bacterium]